MNRNLIFSRRADNGVLSTDDIKQRAPSVFAEDKDARLTKRYHELHTSDLLPVLADHGYFPVQAAQKRKQAGQPHHAAHMLAFAKDAGEGGLRSEIIAYNSHDGTSGVKLFAGAYRYICSNGIIAGEGFSANVRHTHKAMAGFEATLSHIIASLPKMMDTIEALRHRRLEYDEAQALAKKAVELRWDYIDNVYVPTDTAPGTYATPSTVKDALCYQRGEDAACDAWTVLNRIQENVVRGNVMVQSLTQKGRGERKARPIQSIQEHVRVNQQLFDMVAV